MSVTATPGDSGPLRSTGPAVPGDAGVTFAATLIDQWVRLGVRHAVVSPGSRSTPLALACANHPGLSTHVHHDERSAGFMALGIGRATGVAALVVTTSGTAAVELHPAVVEAFQSHVPMLVATADRPPELQGVGAPQTIDQRRLFGSAVRWFVEPGPADHQYRNSWRHLAADAFDAASGAPVGAGPGPVHLNLAFREPLLGEVGELPPLLDPVEPRRVIWALLDEQIAAMRPAISGTHGVIVAGTRAATSDSERSAILELADALGWPVLADHLSGVRVAHPRVVTAFDPILRVPEAADLLRPEFVLRIGGLLASRVTNEWLAASGATQVGLDRWGSVPDPDHVLSEEFTGDIELACRQLMDAGPAAASQDWTQTWAAVESAAAESMATELAAGAAPEPAAVAAALAGTPVGGALFVSSSMPIRDLEWYVPASADAASVTVMANRGANGIDGVTSTALGVALSGTPTVCVIGDVAFLHDTNALLGLAARRAPLCVVVIDNDGGGIFSFLPQAAALPTDRFEQLFGTPHGVDLVALCRSHGVDASLVPTVEDLRAALAEWASAPLPRVLVVPSERGANLLGHRHLNARVADAVRALLA